MNIVHRNVCLNPIVKTITQYCITSVDVFKLKRKKKEEHQLLKRRRKCSNEPIEIIIIIIINK